MTNHPITPPQKLVEQWRNQAPEGMGSQIREMWIATQAAQWGADQELEACSEWWRAARRPKPPSLKEQALELARPAGTEGAHVTFGPEEIALIRRALNQLPDD